MLNSASVARLSSVCHSVCHGRIIVINQCEIGPRLLLITYRKLHIGFQMTRKRLALDDVMIKDVR